MMTCNEARRLQPRLLAMALAADQEAEVRGHLEDCHECRRAFAASDPSFAIGAALRRRTPVDDGAFVAEVMAGVRQRRAERRAGGGPRRRWLAAAAAVAATISAALLFRTSLPSPAGTSLNRVAAGGAEAVAQPALVEVEGQDVRVYQFSASGEDPVRIAFVVDPQLEL